MDEDKIEDDQRDLDWSTVLKRTFEAYIRGERCVARSRVARMLTVYQANHVRGVAPVVRSAGGHGFFILIL